MFESCWLPADCFPLHPALSDWLQDQGSLTRRLTALAQGQFSVRVLEEGWQTLREEECRALNIPISSVGWVREVYLCGEQIPWIFARSVASRAALQNAGIDLRTLGERPLGELLFRDPGFTRGKLMLCHYPTHALPEAIRESNLWARRSCFHQETLGILVAEVFLPSLWQKLHITA